MESTGEYALKIELASEETQFQEHEIELPPEHLAAALRGLVADPKRGAVLLGRSERPLCVAVLAYTWTLEHGGLVAWLDELYVQPEYRNAGVGRAVLARAIEVAKAAGCLALELEVDEDHRRAERLYARAGFERLPRSRWSLRLVRQEPA